MRDEWIHVGRLWTNGEQFLAIDSAGRGDWRGYSDDAFDRTVHLTWEETGLTVGRRMAALLGGDGVVRDDSWVEVFRGESGALAFVQAGGPDYRKALAAALEYPNDQDLDGCGSVPVEGPLVHGTGRELCFARWLLIPVVGAGRRE